LTPGYLLQLLSRHQLLLKIQTFRKSDTFCVDDKKGERDFGVIWEFLYFHVFIYVLFYLDMYLVYLVWTCAWTCAFIEELILWFGTCFEVGMNLCMDNFFYNITVIFGKLCIYFMVDI